MTMNNTLFYMALVLIAGLGIPTMASLNASLGARLQNPLLAVAILTFVAFSISTTLLITTQGIPKTLYVPETSPFFYAAGCFFILYILSVTWVIPKFGVANTIGIVLLGQLIAMTLIDHLGLFGLDKYQISFKRFCGLGFMALGIFLVVSKQS